MTRVEKYRRYREEIANMKVEKFSSKHEASKKIGDVSSNSKVGYEDVMIVHNLYDENIEITPKKHHLHLRLDQILYVLIAFLIIAIILIGIIFTGMKIWR